MENPIDKKSYDELKENAKRVYKKIGRVWSLGLGDHVVFTSAGFRHLLWKGEVSRPKKEQERRLGMIPQARAVLMNHAGPVTTREQYKLRTIKKYGKKVKHLSKATFWALRDSDNDKTVTVIVRQVDNGKKHFFSVY